MWALQGVRLANGDLADIVVEGDRIVDVRRGAADGVAEALTCSEKLVLPAFIDGHVHLDKALIRDELSEHDGTLRGAIDAIHERKRRYTSDDVRTRARSVIEESVRLGTTRLRSHVDVDTIGGQVPLEGVMAAAADSADIAEVCTIAFPQEGLLRDPGAYDLMVAALEAGADVVGGMPHWEHDEASQREHVRLCFDLAERFGRDLDMHVDETDDGGVRTLEMVADEALRRGYIGRVCAGHVCSLAAADQQYADGVIDKCLRAEITIAANAVTNLGLQGRQDWGLRTQYVRRSIASGRPAHPRSADPFRNHPVRRNELDSLAGPDHLPPALMNEAMVEVAERKQIGQVALSALRPELDVMGTGPIDRPVIPRRRAGAMPSFEGPPLRRRDRTCRPADIDHHRVRLEDPAQGAVAGQPLHGLARDRRSVIKLGPPHQARAQLALQGFDAGVDVDVGPDPVAPGQRALVEGVVDDLDQGVGAALLGGADVVLTQGFVEAVDGRPQRRRTLGIQKGVQLVHATQLAQVQVAPLVVLFVVFSKPSALKTLGVPDLARLVGQIAELFDREAPGVVDPV